MKKPEWAGKLLDSRPGQPNKPISMETAYVPAAVFEGAKGESYLRTASTLFPVDAASLDEPVLESARPPAVPWSEEPPQPTAPTSTSVAHIRRLINQS